MENLKIYKELANVPEEAKKQIGAGRLKGFTDINPMWRIKKLTETFGICGLGWYIDNVQHWTELGANGEISNFVSLNLYIKVDGEWSKGIYGIGGSKHIAKESAGLYTSDECYKMAYTDAISVACKALGMGADVYFAKDRSKYDLDTPIAKAQEQQKTPKKDVSKLSTPENWQKLVMWVVDNNKSIDDAKAAYNIADIALFLEDIEIYKNSKLSNKNG